MIDQAALEKIALTAVTKSLMAAIATRESGRQTAVKLGVDLSDHENGLRRGQIERRGNGWVISFDQRCQESQLLEFFLHELSHAKRDNFSGYIDIGNPSAVAKFDKSGLPASYARQSPTENRCNKDAAKWAAYTRRHVPDSDGLANQLAFILQNGIPD